jgi:hypothetical protein
VTQNVKKFTLKDFIFYNGPCFSCGNKVVIKLVCEENNSFKDLPIILQDNYLEITLKLKYSSTLILKLFINDNKYQVSDFDKLTTYLNSKNIYFTSNCKKCRNVITTNFIEFDNIGFCKAITLNNEVLSVFEETEDNSKIYNLISNFKENITEVSVWDKNADGVFRLTIPLLPLYFFKTKKKLLSKIKNYILFS